MNWIDSRSCNYTVSHYSTSFTSYEAACVLEFEIAPFVYPGKSSAAQTKQAKHVKGLLLFEFYFECQVITLTP